MSKKPGRKVLRLGMIQNGRIVEERLMRSPKSVTIGHAYSKNVLVVPASNLPKSYKLFEPSGRGYRLYFNSKMSGRLSLGDGVQTLEELARSGKAKKSGDGYVIELGPKARGKVKFGEVTILFQFVSPPPPRPKPVLPASMRGGWIRGIDPRLAAIIFISAVLQIGFVGWLYTQDFPEELDKRSDIPDRFVEVRPEEEELDLEEEEKEKEEGKEEGDEPSDEEAQPEPQEPEEEPEEEKSAEERAEEESKERQRMAEEVERKTILKKVGAKSEDGGNMVDALSEGTGDTSVEDAFAGSDRVESGKPGAEKDGLDTSGSSDADGTGSAAGIDDPEKSEGAKAAEDKGVDTGKQEEEAVQAKVDVDNAPAETGGSGELDSSRISSVVQRGASAIQRCFERELKNNPEAGGKLVITVTIGGRGRVSNVSTNTGIGGNFPTCAKQAVRGWRFPPPRGGDVTFNKTFVLQASN